MKQDLVPEFDTPPRVKSIASLRRGIDVLRLVTGSDGLALRQLHARSGIPKASLLRIVKTLEEAGCIARRPGDGAYVSSTGTATATATAPSKAVPPANKLDKGHGIRSSTLVTAAAPVRDPSHELPQVAAEALRALRVHMPWPSDVTVRAGLVMRVIDSNRALYGAVWKRRVVGAEVDMLQSAHGRVWLAFCPDAEREELLQALLPKGRAQTTRRERLDQVLAETRRLGYGTRDPAYAGPDADHGRHLSAIAVPITYGSRVIACVSCVWEVRLVQSAQVPGDSLGHLARQAGEMGGRLAMDPRT